MKKILSCALCLVILVLLPLNVFASASVPIAPYYTNAEILTVNLGISGSGNATVTISCVGKSTVKSVYVATYLEKKVNGAWTRVDITSPNDVWSYSTTSRNFTKQYSAQLSGSGDYRAVATFTLTATTRETVSVYSYASY